MLLAAILIACTTAKPVMEWKDPSYVNGPLDRVLVVAVCHQETVRRTFENSFVDRLRTEGVSATASFMVMPVDERPSKAVVRSALAKQQFDSVLVTHLIGVDEKEIYRPPTYRATPYRGLYGYYGHVGSYVYKPGYYTRYDRYKLESNLYDARTEQLIWSLRSETINPSGEQALIDAKTKTVVARMKQQDLISGQ